MWDGAKNYQIGKALREAKISHEEFDACWRDKIQSSIKTDRGKKQLVKLLSDAGLHFGRHGSKSSRLRQKVWLVNKIVGRAAGAAVPSVSARKEPVRAYEGILCMQARA